MNRESIDLGNGELIIIGMVWGIKKEIGLVNREINDLWNGKVMVIGKVWRIKIKLFG